MDLNKLLAGLTSSGVLGGVAGGAVAGAVMGNKKARKHAGTLLQAGGVAALGTLAWKAYQGYKAKQSPVHNVENSWAGLRQGGFAIDESADGPESRGVIVLQAMIGAACADGHIDGAERGRIMARVEQLSLSPAEKALVMDALQQPPSMTDICAKVNCPELAAEVYLSSLLAVDHFRTEARLYLDALAHRLQLPPALAAQLEQEMLAQMPGAAEVLAVA